MYKRDLAVLLLAAFAIYFSLSHEGPFTFKPSWCAWARPAAIITCVTPPSPAESSLFRAPPQPRHRHHPMAAHDGVLGEVELPPPLVADLNGDGASEVVVATQHGSVQVGRGSHSRGWGRGGLSPPPSPLD